jgi:uncharacterized protein YbjT (DUF2867 family)
MKALIIGATGATGKDLIRVLLDSTEYTEVVAFVRKPLNIEHPKLSFVLTNFNNLQDVSSMIKGDILFSCLGTSLKAARSKDRQREIDFRIPARFAEIAKQNGVPGLVLLSAYGAAAGSLFFYLKIKGELENYIGDLAFTQYIIFRPGLLLRKGTDRSGEKISSQILMFLNKLGLLRKFRALPTEILAEKLAKAPLMRAKAVHVIELEDIWQL